MKEIIFLIISLGVILVGAEVFTNGIEWLGKRLKLGEGAVGSILAAVGTALPETMIPIIAIVGGGDSEGGHEVGIGAILGAPFMLGTLALFIVGIAVIFFRRSNKPLFIDPAIMLRDLRFFLIVYFLAIVASFLPNHQLKMVVVIFLVGAYAVYVFRTLKESHGGSQEAEELPPCYIARRSKRPAMILIVTQIAAALTIIVLGAKLFVGAVQVVALDAGIPVLVLSLIIKPIATELPEKFNSVIWVHRGKDTLALGNITGAMVFQSSMIPALGIVLTPWVLEPLALVSAVLAIASALLQYIFLSRKGTLNPGILLTGGLFYVAFIFMVVKGI